MRSLKRAAATKRILHENINIRLTPHGPIARVTVRGAEKRYLEASCCTIASDFSTCPSGERLSSFDESVAMIL